ncbi:MAG: hypothetical protein H6536_05850 [Bacteroidales bacterium]|nr:hypothetical protein [Bacteroidales bacterium]
MRIDFLKRSEIDDSRWNACIDASINGVVYAYSWYLDIVSPGWCALVGDDYHYVFPLPAVRRFGVDVVLQPLFVQQLGLFSGGHITASILQNFIQHIPQRYRLVDVFMNVYNQCDGCPGVSERFTYCLDLVEPYTSIYNRYKQNTRRNNLKSLALGVEVRDDVSLDDFLVFHKTYSSVRLPRKAIERQSTLVRSLMHRGVGQIVGAYFNGELCSATVLVKGNGRLIYLFACSSEQGFYSRAMFAVVDQIIRWNAESHVVLDFEGSMIPSVARFYAGFGAMPRTYPRFSVDRLPWFLIPFFRLRSIYQCLRLFKR